MDNTLWHDAFYRFVRVEDPTALAAALNGLCTEAGVLGTVLVAAEGVNGMLAGTMSGLGRVRKGLEHDERFSGMLFKRTAASKMPFEHLKVKVKRELVPLGVDGVDVAANGGVPGADVPPAEWRALLMRDDVVLLDNRNSFEYALGHFKGALDPGVDNFRDFAAYVTAHLSEWQDKKVAMYCTGGIRCEKTTVWLRDLGLEVYQLRGGILNYFAEVPDAARDFQGECFVFDTRVALDTTLKETDKARSDVDALYASKRG